MDQQQPLDRSKQRVTVLTQGVHAREQHEEVQVVYQLLEAERQQPRNLFHVVPDASLVTNAAVMQEHPAATLQHGAPHEQSFPEALGRIITALEHTGGMVIVTDANLVPPGPRIMYVNPAFTTFTGHTIGEVVGRSPRILQGPLTDRSELDRLRAAIDRGEAYCGTLINYRKGGQPYHVRCSIDPFRDAAGEITHMISVQHALGEHDAATNMAERARSVGGHAGDVLALVGHDLRNPLAAIQGSVRLMQHHLAREHVQMPVIEEGLAYITNAVQTMSALIAELLDGADARGNEHAKLAHSPTDLVALVQQVVREHQQHTTTHTLCIDAAVPQLVMSLDGESFERVLRNMIENAIKYSPAGGEVRIGVAHEAAPQPTAVITIRDHGCGIPPADVPHIFEQFYRASNVVGQIQGTGIGLASAQRIVAQHAGTISVASTEGGGSTFTIRLPLVPHQPPEHA